MRLKRGSALDGLVRRILGDAAAVERVRLKQLSRYYKDLTSTSDDYMSLYAKARDVTSSSDNFLKQNRFFTLFQSVGQVLAHGIEGDMAECGCWHGHSTYMIAHEAAKAGTTKKLWVFDSFEGGLSDKVVQDREQLGNTSAAYTLKQKQRFASNFDAVSQNLSEFQNVALYKGWIPDVFDQPGLAQTRFCLVHIDVDLYEPTRDSLKFFLPRMTKGGVVVIDDFGFSGFPGCQIAVEEEIAKHDHTFFLASHLGGAVIVI